MKTMGYVLVALLWVPGMVVAKEPPRVDSQKIGDALYLLSSNGFRTNMGLVVGGDVAVLIDPSPGKAQLAALDETVRSIAPDADIRILNTHDHLDHAGGNDYLVGQGMSLIDDGAVLPLGLSRVEVNSHSDRDTLVFDPAANAVFTGDVFDNSWHPTFYSGGIDGLTEAVEAILAMGDEDTLIVPGHGEPTDKATLRAFHRNTVAWVERLRELQAQGQSVEQIMADPEALAIVARFDTQGRSSFVGGDSLKRFVEKSLAADADTPMAR